MDGAFGYNTNPTAMENTSNLIQCGWDKDKLDIKLNKQKLNKKLNLPQVWGILSILQAVYHENSVEYTSLFSYKSDEFGKFCNVCVLQ